MKRILAFAVVFVMLISSVACTKKQDEPDDAVIVDNDTDAEATDKSETDKAQKEEQSEDKTQTSEPENDKTSEDDKTVIPDNSEKEDVTEKTEQTPTQTPEKEPDSSTEQTPEKKPDAQTESKSEEKPEEQSKEEPVIYDDSNATPASSFKYRVDKPNNKVHIQKFIGNEKNVVIPNYIDGYPVKSIGIAGFSNTSVENIVISENIEEIQPNAFSGSNLKNVTVKSKSIVFVGGAFDQCPSLESITFMYEQAEFIGPIYHECANLKEVIFLCNAPKCDDNSYVFVDHNKAVIKYKRGTNGWGDIQKLINEGWDRALIEIE